MRLEKKEASSKSVAASVKLNKRKKITPKKYKSPAVSVIARSNKKVKKTHGNQEFTPQQNAVIQFVNENYSSEEFQTEPVFKCQNIDIKADEMISLTLPPGIEEKDKYLPSNIIDAYATFILQP